MVEEPARAPAGFARPPRALVVVDPPPRAVVVDDPPVPLGYDPGEIPPLEPDDELNLMPQPNVPGDSELIRKINQILYGGGTLLPAEVEFWNAAKDRLMEVATMEGRDPTPADFWALMHGDFESASAVNRTIGGYIYSDICRVVGLSNFVVRLKFGTVNMAMGVPGYDELKQDVDDAPQVSDFT